MAKPRKYITPKSNPLNTAILDMFFTFFRKKGSSKIVAKENLMVTKTKGDTLVSATFIIAKVAPQITTAKIISRIGMILVLFLMTMKFTMQGKI